MIGKTISHYTILEKLGEGGMGVVYKAEDSRLQRFVALKFLPDDYAHDPGLRDRFLREARAASALNDPNICTIYDIGEEDGKFFIAMEFLDGTNLKDMVRHGPLPLDQLLAIAADVVDGLHAAHSEGVIHRDIKLANIMVTRGGRAKILDFGLAKKTAGKRAAMAAAGAGSTHSESDGLDMTSGLAALGTAAYMSPEQALGKPLDQRTDLFSFGIVLYEMATGRAPFRGDTTGILFLSIVQQTPEEPRELNPDVPEELQRIIARCLEKRREERYQHASEIRDDLKRLSATAGRHGTASAAMMRDAKHASGERKEADSRPSWPSNGDELGPATAPEKLAEAPAQPFWQPVTVLLLAAALIGTLFLLVRSEKTHAVNMQGGVVVADFANTTGDPVFDGTLRQALAINLAQSPQLHVVSSREIAAALKEMEKPANERLSREVAREVCLRTNSKALIAGSIEQDGNGYGLRLEALDCDNGKMIANAKASAQARDGIINAVGSVGVQMRRQLGESLPSLEKFNKPLVQATTSSLPALQAYSTAQTVRNQQGNLQAIPYAKKAVELDPNFAQAYWLLGILYQASTETTLARESLERAFELRNRVTERERFVIENSYYRLATGDIPKALGNATEWVKAYPADAYAHIALSDVVSYTGQYEEGAEQLREAIRLGPEIYTSYTNLILDYMQLKRPDEAKATYELARARNVDSENLQVVRYDLAFVEGDETTMQSLVRQAKGRAGYENRLVVEAAEAEAFFGRFVTARELVGQAVAAAVASGGKDSAGEHAASQSWREAEVGNSSEAKKFAAEALQFGQGRVVLEGAALTFARLGDEGQAEKLAAELERQYPVSTMMQNYTLPTIRGLIEIKKGNPQKAIALLEAARPYELAMASYADLRPAYVRGLAYLQLHDGAKAADEFQKIVDHPGLVVNSIVGSLSFLHLARAEMMAGDRDAARTHYQDFLALWKDADPRIPIYQHAKAEYARLK